jgi:hypothetical protein
LPPPGFLCEDMTSKDSRPQEGSSQPARGQPARGGWGVHLLSGPGGRPRGAGRQRPAGSSRRGLHLRRQPATGTIAGRSPGICHPPVMRAACQDSPRAPAASRTLIMVRRLRVVVLDL